MKNQKENKRKKAICLLTALILSAGALLAGCGGNAGGGGSSGNGAKDRNGGNGDSGGSGEGRPAFSLFTAGERKEDIPEQVRLDISVPGIDPKLPGAEEMNRTIREQFADFLDDDPMELAARSQGFAYPSFTITYKGYSFGTVHQICVFTDFSSGHGSGASRFADKFFYDEEKGKAVDEDAFLRHLGLNREWVVQEYARAMEEMQAGEAGADYSFEEIQNSFYINEEKKLEVLFSI